MELNHASGETDLMSQKVVPRPRQGVKKERQADVIEDFVLQMSDRKLNKLVCKYRMV
jgi:hypothetical protein